MVPFEDVAARILAACEPLHPAAIPIDDALGMITSTPITSDESVPPFANTAMDGFAVRAADTVGAPVVLDVVGDLPAGRDPAGIEVGPGQAVRIMTGAPIPTGADAIVMVELTSTDSSPGGERVTVSVEVPAGNHVRAAGEDVSPGDVVIARGTRLTPGHLGLLATLGLRRVPVHRRARVGVLSTGDELVDAGALRPGQIRDANRHALMAMVREAGADAVDLGIVGDEEEKVREVMVAAIASCDVLLTSGGVSMGDWDPVKVVMRDLTGPDVETSLQVAIRPAKPLAFAVIDGTPVIGLPGNPASSMVSFELFARPALRALMGDPSPHRRRVVAVAEHDFARAPDGKTHLLRVRLEFDPDDGRLHCTSAGGQGSNLLRSMAAADGLALLPDGAGVVEGGRVEVIDLR